MSRILLIAVSLVTCVSPLSAEPPQAPTTVADVRSQLPATAQQTTSILDKVSTAAASDAPKTDEQIQGISAQIQAIIDARVAKMSPEDRAAYEEGKKDFAEGSK